MEFRILGPLEVVSEGQPLPLGGPKQRALLAILLLHANRIVSAGRLSKLIWNEDPPLTAAHSIEVYVSKLRKVLEPDSTSFRTLVRTSAGYALRINTADLDSARFEEVVEEARRLSPEDALRRLNSALELWRGPALADLEGERFALGEASRLNELRVQALEQRIDAELALGRHEAVVAEVTALMAQFPKRERLAAQLILALYRSGRQAEASDVYQHLREQLLETVGMEPGAELQALLVRVLKQDPTLKHGGQRVVASEPTNNLPIPLTSFVGRTGEVRDLEQLVREFPLVTLVGTGGTGKTRLALQVASGLLNHFRDGAWFVDLSAVTESEGVAQAIAESLGVDEKPGRALLDIVVEYLRGRNGLLFMDNCEQIAGAVADAARTLVSMCPSLRLLATSREQLRIDGERVYQLKPLGVPTAQMYEASEVAQTDSVQLFVERARMSAPSFSMTDRNVHVVADLCRQLDGLPLAIELAAAQIGTLTPNEILARLDDRFAILATGMRARPPRQQSLGATLDWSYRLLEQNEAVVYRRLAVFAGGFDLRGAEVVCTSEEIAFRDVAGAVARLCGKSLVVASEGASGATRYRMLETVRAFAADRLRESGEAEEACRRHARFYLDLVQGAQAGIEGRDAEAWLGVMETEHDNARAALSWAIPADLDTATSLAVAWSPYWKARWHLSEGQRWLTAVLDKQDSIEDSDSSHLYLLAEAKQAAGQIASRQGRHDPARAYFEGALRIGERLGDKGVQAALFADLGLLAAATGDFDSARTYIEHTARALEQVEDMARLPGHGSAYGLRTAILIARGQEATRSGNYARAREYYLQAFERLEAAQSRRWLSVLLGLGEVALLEGDIADAREHLAIALSEAHRLGDLLGVSAALTGCAAVASSMDEPVKAMRLQGAASRVREASGMAHSFALVTDRTIKPRLDSLRQKLGHDLGEAEWNVGHAMPVDQAVEYALGQFITPSQAARR